MCEDGRGQAWCDGYTAKQRDRGSTVVWDIVIGVVEETRGLTFGLVLKRDIRAVCNGTECWIDECRSEEKSAE